MFPKLDAAAFEVRQGAMRKAWAAEAALKNPYGGTVGWDRVMRVVARAEKGLS